MSTEQFKLGMDGKLYYGAEGALLAAMTEMTNVKDVTVTQEKGEADVTTRANSGYRGTAGTLKECTIEWQMLFKPSDAGFQAVRDAYYNNTLINLCPLSGAKDAAGSEGIKGDFSIIGFTKGEPLEGAQTVDVTAKLSVFEEYVEVGS